MPATSITLRVYLDEPPDPARVAPWALSDTMGHALQSGRGTPAEWPDAERKEAIIAAAHGRIATLDLPPLPPGRAEGAARFALEDQLADGADASHVAIGAQRADGKLRAAIVAKAWMDAFVDGSRRCDVEWDRALLEGDLAEAPARAWRWCASTITNPGFVRTDRGSTIAVGPAQGGALPVELALALTRGPAERPATVRVDADGADAAFLSRARERTGVEFLAGRPWRWTDATPASFAAAIDLLSGPYGPRARSPRATARLFRPALAIAAIAIGLHIVATVGQWAFLRWQSYSVEREMAALARAAVPEYAEGRMGGVPPAVALAHRERDLRHRAGLVARDDFVPLLARAAPALSKLPAGALRSLAYADGHFTLDLVKLEANEPMRLQNELRQRGLVAIVAPTQAGARLRIGWD